MSFDTWTQSAELTRALRYANVYHLAQHATRRIREVIRNEEQNLTNQQRHGTSSRYDQHQEGLSAGGAMRLHISNVFDSQHFASGKTP